MPYAGYRTRPTHQAASADGDAGQRRRIIVRACDIRVGSCPCPRADISTAGDAGRALVDVLAQLEVRAGRYDAASRLMQESLSGDPSSAPSVEVVGLVFDALAGRRERSAAVAALDAARARAGSSKDPQFVRRRMVLWYSMLGSYDQAFEIMHASLDEFASTGTIGVAWAFLWMTELAGFRADARFTSLASRLRLPGFWDDHGPPDGYEWRDGRLIAR